MKPPEKIPTELTTNWFNAIIEISWYTLVNCHNYIISIIVQYKEIVLYQSNK